jgi:hypothetical protein
LFSQSSSGYFGSVHHSSLLCICTLHFFMRWCASYPLSGLPTFPLYHMGYTPNTLHTYHIIHLCITFWYSLVNSGCCPCWVMSAWWHIDPCAFMYHMSGFRLHPTFWTLLMPATCRPPSPLPSSPSFLSLLRIAAVFFTSPPLSSTLDITPLL